MQYKRKMINQVTLNNATSLTNKITIQLIIKKKSQVAKMISIKIKVMRLMPT